MELLYIWIEEYRNIYKQGFNLSSRWNVEFHEEEKRVSINPNPTHIEGFFPNGITNVTAIVGENGAGKSNLLTFIRDWVGVHKCKEECFYIIRENHRLHVLFHPTFGFDEASIDCQDSELQVELNPFRLESSSRGEGANWISEADGDFWVNGKENLLKVYYSSYLDGRKIIRPAFSYLIDLSNDARLQNINETLNASASRISQYEAFQDQDIDNIFDLLKYLETSSERDLEADLGGDGFIPFNYNPRLRLSFHSTDSFIDLVEPIKESELENYSENQKWGIDIFVNQYATLLQPDNTGVSFLDELFNNPIEEVSSEGIKTLIFKNLLMNFFQNMREIYLRFNRRNFTDSIDSDEGNFYSPPTFIYDNGEKGTNAPNEFIIELFSKHREDEPVLRLINVIGEIIDNKSQIGEIDRDFDIDSNNLDLSKEEYRSFREVYKDYLFLFNEKARSHAQVTYLNSLDFVSHDWAAGFSSGELGFLRLYSRLLEIPFYRNGKPGGYPDWNRISSILFLLDEAEIGFHPQWQKELIRKVIGMIPQVFDGKTVQILFASHSPFLLSDLPSNNVILIRKGKDDDPPFSDGTNSKDLCIQETVLEGTFAANIHSLFAHSFFLQNGLLGDWAKLIIKTVIDYLNEDLSEEEFVKWEKLLSQDNIQNLIDNVGEPLIRDKLWELFHKRFESDFRTQRLQRLRAEIAALESSEQQNTEEGND